MVIYDIGQGYKMLKHLASIPTQQYGNLITESLQEKVVLVLECGWVGPGGLCIVSTAIIARVDYSNRTING